MHQNKNCVSVYSSYRKYISMMCDMSRVRIYSVHMLPVRSSCSRAVVKIGGAQPERKIAWALARHVPKKLQRKYKTIMKWNNKYI